MLEIASPIDNNNLILDICLVQVVNLQKLSISRVRNVLYRIANKLT